MHEEIIRSMPCCADKKRSHEQGETPLVYPPVMSLTWAVPFNVPYPLAHGMSHRLELANLVSGLSITKSGDLQVDAVHRCGSLEISVLDSKLKGNVFMIAERGNDESQISSDQRHFGQ